MDFDLPYLCSTFDINFEIPTERYIEKFMMKHLSPMEFNRWFGKRNITEERKKQCSISRNRCEVCITRYVGIPWSWIDWFSCDILDTSKILNELPTTPDFICNVFIVKLMFYSKINKVFLVKKSIDFSFFHYSRML